MFKVFPDILDIGVVLKHGTGLAVNASVTLDGLDALAQDDALHTLLLVLGAYANHVEIYVTVVIKVTEYLEGRYQPKFTLAGTYAAAYGGSNESESYQLASLVLHHE